MCLQPLSKLFYSLLLSKSTAKIWSTVCSLLLTDYILFALASRSLPAEAALVVVAAAEQEDTLTETLLLPAAQADPAERLHPARLEIRGDSQGQI